MSEQEKEFEEWANQQALVENAFTVGASQSGLDIARLAWAASIARYVSRMEDLKREYEAEECVFDDPNFLANHAERYSLSMQDSHAKVVMHQLAKLTNANISRIAELEAEVARLKAEREWMPAESAPMDGSKFLAAVEAKFCFFIDIVFYYETWKMFLDSNGDEVSAGQIKGWMTAPTLDQFSMKGGNV